ncbi:MAG: LemA family protein [Deltaproteobacteria bacterium]|nr:LemA family protein [Deltaproteobacteria bacterium]MBW2078818.1 LemA family protein [Deltaproteobacteria bacterium]
MANPERISAAELKDFLSGQIKRLRLLKRLLVWLIILVVLAVIGHVIYYYNRLTTFRYDVVNAEAKMQSAIQYRANLVPVLIKSVTSFVAHEDDVFFRAVDARERSLTMAGQVSEVLEKAAERPMQEILDKIMAIAEQYPDLKTSEPFQLLMKQVTDAEAEILKQRIDYNDRVNVYTTTMSMFPGNIYAALFNFPRYKYFEGSRKSEWPKSAISRRENVTHDKDNGKR